jgi:hypothetical protein
MAVLLFVVWYEAKRQKRVVGIATIRTEPKDLLGTNISSDKKDGEPVMIGHKDWRTACILFTSFFGLVTFVIYFLLQYPATMLAAQVLVNSMIFAVTIEPWIENACHTLVVTVVFIIVELLSLLTPVFWITTNLMGFLICLAAGRLHFKTFTILQVFLLMTIGYHVFITGSIIELQPEFHVLINNITHSIPRVASIGTAPKMYSQGYQFEFVQVFGFCIGSSNNFAYLDVWDLIIGTIISVFAYDFFNETNKLCFYFVVLGYGFSIVLYCLLCINFILIQSVVLEVLVCSLCIVIAALMTGNVKRLFSRRKVQISSNETFQETILIV